MEYISFIFHAGLLTFPPNPDALCLSLLRQEWGCFSSTVLFLRREIF